MSHIKDIFAEEVKDSRGKPTVKATVETDKGSFSAMVPSGASTGSNEALELRDADGVGVLTAIKNVNEIIAPKLKGMDVVNQREIDRTMIELDGTENKSKLGANAILSVSLAVARAGAAAKKVPLYKHISEIAGVEISKKMPLPMFNILNGGRHAKNGLDIQEFMIVPHKKTFAENLVVCNKIFNNLKENIEKSFGKDHLELGDEGGFAPPVKTTEQALYLLKNAVDGEADVKFALDCAASEFYKSAPSGGGKYILDGQEFTDAGLLEFYKDLIEKFPIISIEDPFAEEDWNGFESIVPACRQAGDRLGREIIIVGDDLTTTNIKRIKDAKNKKACTGIILKLNQIGTLSETIDAANLARGAGWKNIVSHRSGETMDTFIADLAVGINADFLKAGSPAKEERMAKYGRLMEIEVELNKK
jgi:enolase